MDISDLTPEQARAILAKRKEAQLSNQDDLKENIDPGVIKLAKSLGMNRTPVSNIRDVLGGMAEGGKNISEFVTGIKSPETAHLQSENPNPILFGAGQYAPAIAAGGASIPLQALSAGVYGTSQHKPGEKTLFGTLPGGMAGRVSGGLEDALFTLTGGAIGKYVPKAIKYMSPDTDAAKLVESLSGGKTAEQNINELSNLVESTHAQKEREALKPKYEIMSEEGNSRIIPSQKNAKTIVNQIENIFAEHPEDITSNKTASLKKALKTYYEGNYKDPDAAIEPGDIDHLIESGEDIYQHPGLNDNDISTLENALEMQKPIKGSYLSIENPDTYEGRRIYGPSIQESHNNYVKNPTVANADDLQSKLFKKQNRIFKRIQNKTNSEEDYDAYKQIKNNRKALLSDIDEFIKTLPVENQQKYSNFKNLWRDQVAIYDNPGRRRQAINQMAHGEGIGITPSQVSSTFNFPNQRVKKIVEHLGEPGKKNILYNQLLKENPNSAYEIGHALEKYHGQGGGESYVSPEMLEQAKSLIKRANTRNIVGPVVGGILGSPFGPIGSAVGSTIGVGATSGKDILRALSKLIAKKT